MPVAGKITGSRFADMMTSGRRKDELFGKTARKLAIKLAAERLGIMELDLDGYVSDAMQHGIDEEELAIMNYERKHFVEVHSKQVFQQHSEFEWIGCTPDGMVLSDGMIEVKNPKSENHLLHVVNGWQLKKYKDQLQGSLWVTGRDWIDFVSHDSRLNGLSLHITRVKRDEDYIKKMQERYLKFEEIISEYSKKLKA